MAQPDYLACPRCGADVFPNQKFCARCGLAAPYEAAVSMQQTVSVQQAALVPTQAAPPPAIEPPQAVPSMDGAPVGKPGQLPFVTGMPARAATHYGSRRLLIVLVLVLVLVLLGVGGGYFALRAAGVFNAKQPPITTTALNTTVPYGDVDVTVLKLQRSASFVDDANTSRDGMIRLSLQAQNKGTSPVTLVYATIATLVWPGGKEVQPTYVSANPTIAPGATSTSTLDFAATAPNNQLVLRLGAANEARVDMPLNGQVDAARYAPKNVKLNKKLSYMGLDWTLTGATSQLSWHGQQASKGMRYVTLDLSVDSTLAQIAIPGPAYDYMRIMIDTTSIPPKDTTLPVSFDAGVTGKTGTVTFLVPQTATNLNLVLASQNDDGFAKAMASFQI